MSYKQRIISGTAYSRLGTETEGDFCIQRDIEEKKTVDGGSVLIPFHAVDRAVMTTTFIDKEYVNPYPCKPSSGAMAADEGEVCVDCAG